MAGLPLFLQRHAVNNSGAPAMRSNSVARGRDGLLTARGKLLLSKPDDMYEQKANQVAEQILRIEPKPPIGGETHINRTRNVGDSPSGIAGSINPADLFHAVGTGQPLDPASRAFMEPRLGYDFRAVRVHTGEPADRAARVLNAQAFTIGSDLFFGEGRFTPETATGRALLAHELAHVCQQPGSGGFVLRRKPVPGKGTDIGESDQPPAIQDVFAGKSYDTKTKEGALEYALDWHTQLLRDYQPYMTQTYGEGPGELGVSFTKQQRTGRAFFIYTTYYWPELKVLAEKTSPADVFKATDDAVNAAHKEAETEDASATRIAPADFRTLFPETFAKDYDAEAKKLREEGLTQFDEAERWKLDSAKRKDKEAFVLFGSGQYRPNFVADLHEEQAARIRKGQWDSLLFSDHKLFFWMEGQQKAAAVAAAEYDKYVERSENPDPLWKEALDTKKQWQADLAKQSKDDGDRTAAEKDLASISVIASLMRNKAGRDVLPANVIDAWNTADQAMIMLRPAAAKGEVPAGTKADTVKTVRTFYESFRAAVTAYDEEKTAYGGKGPSHKYIDNPYFSSSTLFVSLSWLENADDKRRWQMAFDGYNDAVTAMDNFIAVQLEKKGRKDEGEQLKLMGGRARELANLLQEHKNAAKVQAVFYPQDELENSGQPGTPAFAAKSIPLLFYIYRDENEWNLADVTTPQHVKVTGGSGGDEKKPDMAIFSKLDSKLRFPKGEIYFTLPDGTAWSLATTEPWRLSEWLTWIGIGIAVIGLAIATAGGSIPATVIVIGAAVGVAAGVSDIVEKKRAGVLTTKDVVVDGLQIIGSVLAAGSAKLGQVVLSEAAAAGIAASEVGGLAGRSFIPITIAAVGSDFSSFAIVAGDSLKALSDIDKQPGSDEDRKLAKLRVVAQLIGMGLITFLAIKGNMAALRVGGTGLHVDVGPNGELSAQPLLTDAQLLESAKGMKNPEAITKLLGDDGLAPDLRNRIRAGLSEALTAGPIAPRKVEELLGRLRATAKPEEINAILAELSARSRVGAICGGEVAARLSAEEAALLAHLDDATFAGLKGASPRDLRAIAAVLALDAKDGARLINEYGSELLDFLRTNPLSDLAQLEKILANNRVRVTERIKGLYEGIDTTKPPEGGWKFDDGPGVILDSDHITKILVTRVTGPNGAQGFFERAYNPITRRLELRQAFLRLGGQTKEVPRFVPRQGELPEMIGGRGTPTVQYVSLYQMKRLGVPLGEAAAGVRTIHMSNIQYVETIIHLHWLRQQYPTSPLNDLIEFTASMTYAETTATQSGYQRSGRPVVSGGVDTPISELLEYQAGGNKERITEQKAILDKYGFKEDTVMHWGFDIDFPVMQKVQ